jgi:hypothetical protein
MANVLSDIATFLAAQSLGVFDTTPGSTDSTIFTHTLPDAPAAAFSVELYGTAPPGPYLFDDTLPMYENPRLQITRRDPDADTAFAGAYAAMKALIALSDATLGGVHYFAVRLVSGPIGLGQDDNNLWRYVVNVQAMKVLS